MTSEADIFFSDFCKKKKDNLLSIYCLAGLTSCLTLAYEVVNNVFVQVVQIKIDKNVFFQRVDIINW